MKRGIVMIRLSPKAGMDEEFIIWYRDYFTRSILLIPGFKSARGFKYIRPEAVEEPGLNEFEYLTIYEVEAEDLLVPLRALYETEAGRDSRLKVSQALSFEPHPTNWFFEEVFHNSGTEGSPSEWEGRQTEGEAVKSAVDSVLGWVNR